MVLCNHGFHGKLTIEEDHKDSWRVKYDHDTRPDSSLGWDYSHFWICSPRKLEFRHPHDPWISYVQLVFVEEMASALKGKISDEGVYPPGWAPHPEKYPSYRAWVDLLYSRSKKIMSPTDYEDMIAVELDCAPQELKDC